MLISRPDPSLMSINTRGIDIDIDIGADIVQRVICLADEEKTQSRPVRGDVAPDCR